MYDTGCRLHLLLLLERYALLGDVVARHDDDGVANAARLVDATFSGLTSGLIVSHTSGDLASAHIAGGKVSGIDDLIVDRARRKHTRRQVQESSLSNNEICQRKVRCGRGLGRGDKDTHRPSRTGGIQRPIRAEPYRVDKHRAPKAVCHGVDHIGTVHKTSANAVTILESAIAAVSGTESSAALGALAFSLQMPRGLADREERLVKQARLGALFAGKVPRRGRRGQASGIRLALAGATVRNVDKAIVGRGANVPDGSSNAHRLHSRGVVAVKVVDCVGGTLVGARVVVEHTGQRERLVDRPARLALAILPVAAAISVEVRDLETLAKLGGSRRIQANGVTVVLIVVLRSALENIMVKDGAAVVATALVGKDAHHAKRLAAAEAMLVMLTLGNLVLWESPW